MLFPLSEAGLLGFDLFGEASPELFLFFPELGVVHLLNFGLSKLPGFHLLLTVVLIVELLRS